MAIVGLALSSCGEDDEKEISSGKLPAAAKEFINQYWPSTGIVSSRQERKDYEVILADGTRLNFDKEGSWFEVEARLGQTVPTGFYPVEIDVYIASHLNGAGIHEITKETVGYEVKLLTGVELLFSNEGTYIGIDRE